MISKPHLRPLTALLAVALALPMIAAFWHARSQRALQRRVQQAAEIERLLPHQVLWAWERPEDLHILDPNHTAVAVLEETLRLGSHAEIVSRRQPILLPSRIVRIAVVRIETAPDFASHKSSRALLQSAVADLTRVSKKPGISALQIDFDARRSERPFYRDLLGNLRATMPPDLPLEITALVSWCSTDDWIADLPVNAAIPMFFRMEPDRRRLTLASSPAYRIREPLCQSSLGVSTRELWPGNRDGKRLYVFADLGWKQDIALLPVSFFQEPRP